MSPQNLSDAVEIVIHILRFSLYECMNGIVHFRHQEKNRRQDHSQTVWRKIGKATYGERETRNSLVKGERIVRSASLSVANLT